MGLFDTPLVIHRRIHELKQLDHDYFPFDVIFCKESDIFKVNHDYFGSPCYFHVCEWKSAPSMQPVFRVEYFPTNSNTLTLWKNDIKAADVLKILNNWIAQVEAMLKFEHLYADPELESIREDLRLRLGLSEEHADQIIDETQKRHAKQFCDQITDILRELDEKEYDSKKIKEIIFDLNKIKRDIDSLRIKTQGDLAFSITNAWGRIRLAKIGKFLLSKASEGAGGKLIETILNAVSPDSN